MKPRIRVISKMTGKQRVPVTERISSRKGWEIGGAKMKVPR